MIKICVKCTFNAEFVFPWNNLTFGQESMQSTLRACIEIPTEDQGNAVSLIQTEKKNKMFEFILKNMIYNVQVPFFFHPTENTDLQENNFH